MTKIQNILKNYSYESPAVKANLYRILNQGKLKNGKLVILPVDQGFEHGPERSFSVNYPAYDPCYHAELAIKTGLNAFAAPLGMIEMVADQYAGQIPLILKLNSANSLLPKHIKDQAITGSIDEAVRLGCSAVGFTIYPASDSSLEMFEEISQLTEEAKAKGLAVVIWSYARGSELPAEHETSVDVISYAAHMACLLGAHIVKVKPPKESIFCPKAKEAFENGNVKISTLADRIAVVKRSCFDGKKIVIFSGGNTKGDNEVLDEISQINQGGGFGSIIGRNVFQRKEVDAINLLEKVMTVWSK
jgi:class I fructose-bisphosphate aldolase